MVNGTFFFNSLWYLNTEIDGMWLYLLFSLHIIKWIFTNHLILMVFVNLNYIVQLNKHNLKNITAKVNFTFETTNDTNWFFLKIHASGFYKRLILIVWKKMSQNKKKKKSQKMLFLIVLILFMRHTHLISTKKIMNLKKIV